MLVIAGFLVFPFASLLLQYVPSHSGSKSAISIKAPDLILLTNFAAIGESPASSKLCWAEAMGLIFAVAEMLLGGCSPMRPMWSSWSPGGMWSSAK